MFKWIFLFVVMGCLSSARVWAYDCSGFASSNTVDLIVREPSVNYDYSLSNSEIAQIGSDSVHANGVTLGLTQTRFSQQVNGKFRVTMVPGGVCVALTTISVEIGYLPINVYITNKYAEGSCEKNAVLEHENDHVRFATDTFNTYLPGFKYVIEQIAQQTPPVFGTDQKTTVNLVLQNFSTGVSTVISKMNAAREVLDRQLDSPASYQSTAAKCNHW